MGFPWVKNAGGRPFSFGLGGLVSRRTEMVIPLQEVSQGGDLLRWL
jgi:hypothetical protein